MHPFPPLEVGPLKPARASGERGPSRAPAKYEFGAL